MQTAEDGELASCRQHRPHKRKAAQGANRLSRLILSRCNAASEGFACTPWRHPRSTPMLCSQLQLVKDGDGYSDVKPLECRAWSCAYCAPKRRARLMAQAASGSPNRCLTLSIRSSIGISPADRYQQLHNAWKLLAKRIARQFALHPDKRWKLQTNDGGEYQSIKNHTITKTTKQKEYTSLQYLAFVEATKLGEPHLHILIRSPYIPQDWVSQQMAELVQSPVVWIDLIKNTKSAIAYVSKYVTKAPAQFGKTRRYWCTRKWEVNKPDQFQERQKLPPGTHVVLKRWTETLEEIETRQLIPLVQSDGWLRLYNIRGFARDYPEEDMIKNYEPMFKAMINLGRINRREALVW